MQVKYAQGCKSKFSSACMSTAPAANREASVIIEKGHVTSEMHRTSAKEKMCLRHSNTFC